MAIPTPLKPTAAPEQQLQTVYRASRTRTKRTLKLVLLYLLIAAAGVLAALWAYDRFQPAALTHPEFEADALTGTPQVDERYGYSTLAVEEDYRIQLCGVPANDGRNVAFYFTNPADNGVWFRAEVLGEGDAVLASTGILRPGEYLPVVTLGQRLTQREAPVTVRIVAYAPDTWQSRGNVKLNLTLYLEYA